MLNVKIAVVGAGINGLGSALCLAEQLQDCNITILSSEFFPAQQGMTSVHGFGIVGQRGNGILDNEDVSKYILQTKVHCRKMHPMEAEMAGIRHCDFLFFHNPRKVEDINSLLPERERHMLNIRSATEKDMRKIKHVYSSDVIETIFEDRDWGALQAFVEPAFVINTSKYMPWLWKKLSAMKMRDGSKMVTFVQRRVTRLSELFDSYDLVINCSGLGARWLASDQQVVPTRGQYISVEPLPIDKAYLAGETIICPQHNNVLLGGCYEFGRSNVDVEPDTTERILRRCETLLPAVKGAKVRYVGVGIRPTRIGGARIELEWSPGIAKGARFPVIHNYGHGAKGIGQHWGCALEVARLAKQVFSASSKL